MSKNALIIVDIQNDFVDGSLATDPALVFTEKAANWLFLNKEGYDHVVTTQDWHVEPGDHFETWPVHCRADTRGAEIHSLIVDALGESEYECFLKGQYSDGYSGFDGTWEKDGKTGLAEWLHDHNVDSVDIIGIATDHCVRATAVSAFGEGFDTTVLKDLVNGVDPEVSKGLLENGFTAQGIAVR